MGGIAKSIMGGNSGPSENTIKSASIYPELRDPAYDAIQDARRLYEQGYAVPGLNRRSWEGVESTEDWASKFGGMIDEPTEYASWLSQGKGVGDAPGQEYLQNVYRNGAGTAGYGSQEQILQNLMQGNGAGYGTQEQILRDVMGKTGNLDYVHGVAGGQYLGGNPRMDAVLSDINRDTTRQYQSAIGSLEGGMSRAGGAGGSVESQLKARENEGLGRALAANEANIRYGDYNTERGYQQQAGMALPGMYQTDVQTKMGAAGQLNDMQRNWIQQQQGAAGQLSDMQYRKLMAEMQAATGAGAGYRQDIGQALQAGGLMPALGQAGFLPGQQLREAGEYTRQAGQQQANAGWEGLQQYLNMLKGVQGLTYNPGQVQQGASPTQNLIGTGMNMAGTAASIYGMSDRRLKTDVQEVGHGLYRWRYVWGGPIFEGPMAQDVPEVAVAGPGGYLMIPASLIREVPDGH